MIHRETTPITPDSDRDDGLETTSEMDGQSLVYQELPARLTNPVKLVALLRMQFGVGKYDVSVSNKRTTAAKITCIGYDAYEEVL